MSEQPQTSQTKSSSHSTPAVANPKSTPSIQQPTPPAADFASSTSSSSSSSSQHSALASARNASINGGKFHGSPRMHNSHPNSGTGSRRGQYRPRGSVQYSHRPTHVQASSAVQYGSVNQAAPIPLSSSPVQHAPIISGAMPLYPQVSGRKVPAFGIITPTPPPEEYVSASKPFLGSDMHHTHQYHPHYPHPQTSPHHHRPPYQKGGPVPMATTSTYPSKGVHIGLHSPHMGSAQGSPSMQPMVAAIPQAWAQQYYVAAPYSTSPQFFPSHPAMYPAIPHPPHPHYAHTIPHAQPLGNTGNSRMSRSSNPPHVPGTPKSSKAVPIVHPGSRPEFMHPGEEEEEEERELDELEIWERKEAEKKRQEELERAERERKGELKRERLEREEKEKRDREEKQREEQERKEREQKELLEREREREEKERREKEEREKKEKEEKERIEREREEKERREREERARREKEEKERREREEKEKREQEEKEKREQEERERREREEKERREQEEKEKQERLERERKKKQEEESLEHERIKQEQKTHPRQEPEKRLESEPQDPISRGKQGDANASLGTDHHANKDSAASAENTNKSETSATSAETKRPKLNLSLGSTNGMLSAGTSSSMAESPTALISPRSPGESGRRYKYNRDFLMQFMALCRDRPSNLPPVESVVSEDAMVDIKPPSSFSSGAPSGPRRTVSSSGTRGIKSPNFAQYPTDMGQFKSIPKTPTLSSGDDRFGSSSTRLSMTSTNSSIGSGGKPSIGRSMSSGSQMNLPALSTGGINSTRSRSGRGGSRKGTKDYSSGGQTHQQAPADFAPLQKSENRWVPTVQVEKSPSSTTDTDQLSLEIMQRKVKSLLNKLTLEKFDSISEQIIEFANRSRNETDGESLRSVIQLVFEKATDESNFATMYAQLCRRMMERVHPEVKDESLLMPNGRPTMGGHLFRKYLLTRCQEDFERGWKFDVPQTENGEVDIMSDEYYAAVKAKRRGLGLIRFIGELFKLSMLTEKIMHGCIQKLLANTADPEEEEMESLCQLMTTVGKQLDRPEARPNIMEQYIARLQQLTENPKLPSRIKFMLMDVIDLRVNRWIPRRDSNAPKTIAQIHEAATREERDRERENAIKRSASSGCRGLPNLSQQLSRSASHRGSGSKERGSSTSQNSGDGWNTVGGGREGSGGARNERKAGDLGGFGRVDRSKFQRGLGLGPGSSSNVFASLSASSKKKDAPPGGASAGEGRKEEKSSPGGIGSNNMFSALAGGEVEPAAPAIPQERKKLNILPRTKPLPDQQPQQTQADSGELGQAPATRSKYSKEEAEKKIKNSLEEFWNIRNIEEVIYFIEDLEDPLLHTSFLSALLNSTIERRKEDVSLTCQVLHKVAENAVIPRPSVHSAFAQLVEMVGDIAIDVPSAYSFMGQLLVAARLTLPEVEGMSRPLLEEDSQSVPAAAKLLAEYLKAAKGELSEEKFKAMLKGLDARGEMDERVLAYLTKQVTDLLPIAS
ncbi:uncharacterized protein VTP21DRAFT_6627 [Calcarisporiella thermophila]|uniref:uncharacterized protein n=1 Tax=Calcarisporiella thermophila TaxID=911321 RepID=UPI003742E752